MRDADSTAGAVLLILRALGFLAVAVAALVGGQPAAAATLTPSATHGLAYVALGDSYAAGYGLADPTGEPVAGCSQSALDYPHRVAKSLGLDLTDVSCSGATTANIVNTRQDDAAPQVSALGTATKVVTVTIGGNDANLFGSSSKCIALSPTGPVFGQASTVRSCKQQFVTGGHDSFNEAISTTTATGLAKAFAAISKAAPNARVFVVGYPAVFPDAAHTPSAGCFRPVVDSSTLTTGFPQNGFPFTNTDVAYLAGVQAHLDQVLRQATAHAGFTFVDTLAASEGHSACSTSGAYINGITLTASDGFTKISLQTGALHPNDRGAAYLAARTAAAITASFAATPSGSAAAGSGSGSGGFTIDLVWLVLAGVLVVFAVIVLVAGRSLRRGRRRDPGD